MYSLHEEHTANEIDIESIGHQGRWVSISPYICGLFRFDFLTITHGNEAIDVTEDVQPDPEW